MIDLCKLQLIKLGVGSCVLSLQVFPVYAEEHNDAIKDNWYAGAFVNTNYASNACESQAIFCNSNLNGGGAFVGRHLSDWLALQVGYDYFGKIKADYPALVSPEINAPYYSKTQGVEIALLPRWQLSTNTSIYAKLGALGWQMDVTGHEIGMTYQEQARGWSPLLGLGGEWSLTHRWHVFAEYQWTPGVGGDDTGGTNLNSLNVGIRYLFGNNKKQLPPHLVSSNNTNSKNSELSMIDNVSEEDNIEVVSSKTEPTFVSSNVSPDWSFSGASFEFERATLTPSAREQLAETVVFLKRYPQAHLIIVAHTDSIGSDEYNQKLSERRAIAVKQYFIEQGISDARLTSEGFGERLPLADNHFEQGRTINRRIDLYAHINNDM